MPSKFLADKEIRINKDKLDLFIRTELDSFCQTGKMLLLPPDITRYFSFAGEITKAIFDYRNGKNLDIMPATGTHKPMTSKQLDKMFPGIPHDLFLEHDWRHDTVPVGDIESEFIKMVTEGIYNKSWPAELNRTLLGPEYDCIISIGQVVPHEVVGMANHSKNLFIGTGGAQSINQSHYFSALYGIENILGQIDTPLRKVLNEAYKRFCADLNILFILTVVEPDENGFPQLKGIFSGRDTECFNQAAKLSQQLNITSIKNPPNHFIVLLPESEYQSTWLGNKAIYRSRLAIPDGGKLTVIAPGVKYFGEDLKIDQLIRKYGYKDSETIKSLVNSREDLANNLSAAAHLIHGHHNNRFEIVYTTPHLGKTEIENVGYIAADFESTIKRYNPENLYSGFNTMPDGETIYFIPNPGSGLWKSE